MGGMVFPNMGEEKNGTSWAGPIINIGEEGQLGRGIIMVEKFFCSE